MRPTLHPLQLALGLTAWLLWFLLAYAAVSLGCVDEPRALADSTGRGGLRAWLLGSAAAVTVTLAAGAERCLRAARGGCGTPRFLAQAAGCLHIAAAVSVVFVAAPVAWVAPCA